MNLRDTRNRGTVRSAYRARGRAKLPLGSQRRKGGEKQPRDPLSPTLSTVQAPHCLQAPGAATAWEPRRLLPPLAAREPLCLQRWLQG